MSPLVTRPAPPAALLRAERIELSRERVARVSRWREPLALFLIAYGVFATLGVVLTLHYEIVLGDAQARLQHAFFIWANDPSKLAAIGFYWPPIQTLVLLPLAAIKPLATSMLALPLTSAAFGAGTVVVLSRALEVAKVERALRWALVAAFALNPMILFYSANGMAEIVYLFFLSLALYCFLRWTLAPRWQDLVFCGGAFGFAVLSRYEVAFWLPLVIVGVLAQLIRQRAAVAQLESSFIALVVPALYGLALWSYLTWTITGDALGWLKILIPKTAEENPFAVAAAPQTGDLLAQVFMVHATLYPPTFVIPLVLFIIAWRKRSMTAAVFGAAVLVNLLSEVAILLRSSNTVYLELRYNMRAMPVAVIAIGLLLALLPPARRRLAGIGALVLLALAIPASAATMLTSPWVGQDRQFMRSLLYGESGSIVNQRTMAEYIRERITGDNVVFTDDQQTFGIQLLDGSPTRYFDRVDIGDARWAEVRDRIFARGEPVAGVRYILVRRDPLLGDLIALPYPSLATTQGVPAFLRLEFVNANYALYRIIGTRRGGT